MCDTLCAVGDGRTLFGKNSDRPPSEVQLVRTYPPRAAGTTLRTQYLEIDDRGASAVLLSQPDWLWGAEHGVNEHGVAIGNERVFTVDDPAPAPPALIGMDLVRLGLELGRTAAEAVDVMTSLLERHGQGGVCDRTTGDAYWSSFLVADATEAYVVETTARRWTSRHVEPGATAAISNAITLRDDWRDPAMPSGFADVRREASDAFLCGGAPRTREAFASHLRDHGGSGAPPPDEWDIEGKGWTVCVHIRGLVATTAGMVCELRVGRGAAGMGVPWQPVRVGVRAGRRRRRPRLAVGGHGVAPLRGPP